MTKKTRFFPTILAFAFAFGLIFAGLSTAADKKVYKLRMQILFGPDMMWQYQPFIDYCKDASDGRLIIQPFSGSQLVPDDQMRLRTWATESQFLPELLSYSNWRSRPE